MSTTNTNRRFLVFEDRTSDSPFVERIWHCHSERAGSFLSIAASHWEMVVTRYRGKIILTVRGPETKATIANCPAEGQWIGIRFKFGTFMPQLRPGDIRDRRDVNLPNASGHSFWLNGSAWEYPSFENSETFVSRLVHDGLIARDLKVAAVLQDQPEEPLPPLCAASFSAINRDDPQSVSSNRTCSLCDKPAEARRLDSRHSF